LPLVRLVLMSMVAQSQRKRGASWRAIGGDGTRSNGPKLCLPIPTLLAKTWT
jgi:hypothetical protein